MIYLMITHGVSSEKNGSLSQRQCRLQSVLSENASSHGNRRLALCVFRGDRVACHELQRLATGAAIAWSSRLERRGEHWGKRLLVRNRIIPEYQVELTCYGGVGRSFERWLTVSSCLSSVNTEELLDRTLSS